MKTKILRSEHIPKERGNKMLLYPSINTLRDKTDSRYSLVILAAKRARDIIDGKPALTEEESERPVSQAAKEIAADMITVAAEDGEE